MAADGERFQVPPWGLDVARIRRVVADGWREAVVEESRAVSSWRRLRGGVEAGRQASHIVAGAGRAIRAWRRAVEASRTSSAAATVAGWTRDAAVVRWLTREPDPQVVIVDLRETRTVGPALGVFEWAGAGLAANAAGSLTGRAGDALAEAVRRRPLQVLGVVLLVATAASATLSAVAGSLGPTAALVHGLAALVAVAGIASDATLADVRETRVARAVVRLVEPPAESRMADDSSEPSRERDG